MKAFQRRLEALESKLNPGKNHPVVLVIYPGDSREQAIEKYQQLHQGETIEGRDTIVVNIVLVDPPKRDAEGRIIDE